MPYFRSYSSHLGHIHDHMPTSDCSCGIRIHDSWILRHGTYSMRQWCGPCESSWKDVWTYWQSYMPTWWLIIWKFKNSIYSSTMANLLIKTHWNPTIIILNHTFITYLMIDIHNYILRTSLWEIISLGEFSLMFLFVSDTRWLLECLLIFSVYWAIHLVF